MEISEKLISNLPESPGIYQFIDKKGEIIYIGKAKNLHKRVASYYHNKIHNSIKTEFLVKKACTLKYIVVNSEEEALLLENNLIKKHKPKYNILLKDDKTYPWICIRKEAFPRVQITRRMLKDGSEYYGPYTSGRMVKTLIEMIREMHQIRTCNYVLTDRNIKDKKFKKCLEFHISKCKAPCEGLQSNIDYVDSITQVKMILKGRIRDLIEKLKLKMIDLSNDLKYEDADKVKQQIRLIEKYKSKSTVVSSKLDNIDVFSYLEDDKKAYVNYIKVVEGAIIQSQTNEIIKYPNQKPGDILLMSIAEIRENIRSDANEIIIPFDIGETINNLKFIIPKTGEKKKLLDLSIYNAKHFVIQKKSIDKELFKHEKSKEILEQVKKDLNLKKIPEHIECYDNSNLFGTNPVAASVVFRNGKPSQKEYRHYNIKSIQGIDDFASMQEIVYRRIKHLLSTNTDLPDLIIIDGGKGQLNAAVESLKELKVYGNIAILGLAKKLEELFFPNDEVPLYLSKTSTTLKLIQNLRNEAHRFGITFHRKKRSKNMIRNNILDIHGIGEKTLIQLTKRFGSIEKIKDLKREDVEKEIGTQKTQILFDHLNKH